MAENSQETQGLDSSTQQDIASDSGDKQSASDAFKKAEKVLDTMANKKVIHANKASRTKSRLSKRIKSL